VSQRERALMADIGRLANGYEFDEIIGACGNIILNALRQKHPKLEDAKDQLQALIGEMDSRLAKDHYNLLGYRRDQRLVIPDKPLLELVKG
jgi:hypothetical protein